MTAHEALASIVNAAQNELLEEWVRLQLTATTRRADLMSETELREQSRQFLRSLAGGLASGATDRRSEAWSAARSLVAEISRTRARQGFTPAETATFVLSVKQPIFARIAAGTEPARVGETLWLATEILDDLALYTTDVYQRGREEVIQRQHQDMLELSTPVVRLWQGILALPLIGTLDSARTQVVMETLLQQIVDEKAAIAIIDITGVPTVDTLVAQHLLKTVAAARLMGADCIVSGIRPQIAQTIVHLGVELGEVTTKASLSDAFAVALRRQGLVVRETGT